MNWAIVSICDAMSVTISELVVVSGATLPRRDSIGATDGASTDARA